MNEIILEEGQLINFVTINLDDEDYSAAHMWAVGDGDGYFCVFLGEIDHSEYEICPGWRDVLIKEDQYRIVPFEEAPDKVIAALASWRLLGEMHGKD